MPNIQKLLSAVADGKYDDKALVNLYRNTLKYDSISEAERESVVQAVTAKLRNDYPRAAKKLFGPIDSRAREVLEEVNVVVSQYFDLTDNKLRNGVKLGGLKRSGEAQVDLYLSYKGTGGRGVLAGVSQKNLQDPLVFRVFSFKGSSQREVADYVEYVGETPEFQNTYVALLSNILMPVEEQRKAA